MYLVYLFSKVWWDRPRCLSWFHKYNDKLKLIPSDSSLKSKYKSIIDQVLKIWNYLSYFSKLKYIMYASTH